MVTKKHMGGPSILRRLELLLWQASVSCPSVMHALVFVDSGVDF